MYEKSQILNPRYPASDDISKQKDPKGLNLAGTKTLEKGFFQRHPGATKRLNR